MNKMKTQIIQRILAVLVVVLFVAFYGFLGIAGHEVFFDRERLSEATDIDALNERLVPLFYQINAFPKRVAQEVLFLSELSSLKNVVERPSQKTYEKLLHDLFTPEENNGIYHKILYINERREEQMRMTADGKVYFNTPENSLGAVINDSYVSDIFALSEGEVYISDFDFAAHADSARNGTATEQTLIVRFGTPVMGNDGKREGIIVAEIYANFFLDDIRNLSRDNEQIFLLDQDGQYLVHPEIEKEYGTLLGTQHNFIEDYPKVAKQVLSQFEKRLVISDTSFFSLRHIFPATANYALARGSQRLLGANPDRDFFWVLISVVDKEDILSRDGIFGSYDFFIGFSGLFMALILGVLFIILEIARRRTSR